jgi:hypothetical protein
MIKEEKLSCSVIVMFGGDVGGERDAAELPETSMVGRNPSPSHLSTQLIRPRQNGLVLGKQQQ